MLLEFICLCQKKSLIFILRKDSVSKATKSRDWWTNIWRQAPDYQFFIEFCTELQKPLWARFHSKRHKNKLFQASYFCMCQDGLSATCYCSKHSLSQRSLQHFGHLQDTLDQAMSHSRGSVCKDSSETEVQITSVGALISPIELTARLINHLQLFWSVLKLFISAVSEVWSIFFCQQCNVTFSSKHWGVAIFHSVFQIGMGNFERNMFICQ